ncbi:SGNH/GDSL hydrolase family protein [Campylobacter upsaliensis]
MQVIKFLFILIVVFVLVVLVMNKSISSYLEQKYHIIFYPQNDILNEANALKVKLEQVRMILSNESISTEFEAEKEENLNVKEEQNLSLALEKPEAIVEPEANISFIDNTKLEISLSEEFLLIGDSLMQGVAVALNKDLKNLGLKVVDLSKQNTGLSYKSYFDWAKETTKTLQNNKKIKYLVVLLGANDPWNIKKGGIYHRFNSKSWLEIYTQRVDEILKIAAKYNAKVLWYEIPPVKKDDLNKKLSILNQIYSQEILKNKGIFINTKLFFSKNDAYSAYIKDENNKSIKVRSDDGVHFTPSGAKEMSKLLLEYIKLKDNNASF